MNRNPLFESCITVPPEIDWLIVEVYIHEARAAVVLKAEGCEGLEDKMLKQVRFVIMDLLAQWVIAILIYISFSAACTVGCWDWDEEMVLVYENSSESEALELTVPA